MPDTSQAPAVTRRQAFDELLRRKVAAIAAEEGRPGREGATEDAQLMEAQCRAFADAVDRDGRNLAYGDVIVIAGTSGEVVVPLRDYVDTPVYWQSLAGEVELVTDGADVMDALNHP